MKCSICGYAWERGYAWGKNGLCWNCSFWQPFIESQQGLRYHGIHYSVCGDLEPNRSGLDGSTWEFYLTDGRVLVCTNVSCQGTIPARFREQLKNNVFTIRTSWRGRDEVSEEQGWGNVPVFDKVEVPAIVVVEPLRVQTSLFDML